MSDIVHEWRRILIADKTSTREKSVIPVQCKTEYVYSVIDFASLLHMHVWVYNNVLSAQLYSLCPYFTAQWSPMKSQWALATFVLCLSHCRLSSRNLLEWLHWEVSLLKWGNLWIGRILHLPSRTYWTLLHKERYVCGTVSVWQYDFIATTRCYIASSTLNYHQL